jgi:multimeric flavodoxin WrbA
MKYLIVSGNPKKDGLCHAIMEQVENGARDGGADVNILTVENLDRCHVCGDGWGSCRESHTCAFGKDGFDAAQKQIRDADAICVITPVYWWEMAEGLKSFLDRFRRCEFSIGSDRKDFPPAMKGKQTLLIASAGGTGNGTVGCLQQMDRFCLHAGAIVFDDIAVNRWNKDYKGKAAYAAAKAIAEGRKNNDTV